MSSITQLAAVVALLIPVCGASTIYSAYPNEADGLDISEFVVADTFSLTNAVILSELTFWSSANVEPFPSQFSGLIGWGILSDNSGTPGAFLASGVTGNTTLTDTAMQILGTKEWTVNFAIPSLSLLSGNYWLALHENAFGGPSDSTDIFWDTTSALGSNPAMITADPNGISGWQVGDESNLAFQLVSSIPAIAPSSTPEPSTLLLMSLAFVFIIKWNGCRLFTSPSERTKCAPSCVPIPPLATNVMSLKSKVDVQNGEDIFSSPCTTTPKSKSARAPLFVISALVLSSSLHATTIGLPVNTGIAPSGIVDPNYTSTVSTVRLEGDPAYYAWIGPNQTSAWIGPDVYDGSTLNNGYYTLNYIVHFDSAGLIANSIVIVGQVAVDNVLNDITVNGVSNNMGNAFSSANYSSWKPFSLSQGFLSGDNTLDFSYSDLGGPGGLRVEFTSVTGSAASPSAEPPLLMLIGLVALFVGMSQNRRTPNFKKGNLCPTLTSNSL